MSSGTERIWELLSAYADGEVTENERSEVERLLAEDKRAAELYARLSSTRDMLSSMQQISAPARIRHNLNHAVSSNHTFFARLRRMISPRNLRMPVLSYAGAVLVIIMAVILTTVLNQTTISPETEQIASAKRDSELAQPQDSPESREFAMRMEENSNTSPPSPGEPIIEETEELLAEFDSGDAELDDFGAAGADRRTMTARSRVGMAGAPAPSITPVASRPTMYRAEVIQAYHDFPNNSEGIPADSGIYTLSSDNSVDLDFSAPTGSRRNPMEESVDLGVIGMPSVDFPQFNASGSAGSVMISGKIHVSAHGRVVSYRLSGPSDSRVLIDHYAAHLTNTRMMPALLDGQPVSVLYNFIATIYRIDESID